MKTIKFNAPADLALLRQILENPAEPYATADMLSAVRVMARLPSEEIVFNLEDADHEFVARCVGAVRWVRASAETGAFVDAIYRAGS